MQPLSGKTCRIQRILLYNMILEKLFYAVLSSLPPSCCSNLFFSKFCNVELGFQDLELWKGRLLHRINCSYRHPLFIIFLPLLPKDCIIGWQFPLRLAKFLNILEINTYSICLGAVVCIPRTVLEACCFIIVTSLILILTTWLYHSGNSLANVRCCIIDSFSLPLSIVSHWSTNLTHLVKDCPYSSSLLGFDCTLVSRDSSLRFPFPAGFTAFLWRRLPELCRHHIY